MSDQALKEATLMWSQTAEEDAGHESHLPHSGAGCVRGPRPGPSRPSPRMAPSGRRRLPFSAPRKAAIKSKLPAPDLAAYDDPFAGEEDFDDDIMAFVESVKGNVVKKPCK